MIRLEHVTKAYGDLLALDDVSITIHKGDFVIVYGESGSGKSTLLQVLGGLLKVDSGAYWFEGENVFSLSMRRLDAFRKCCIGFVFQQFYLVPYLSAYENVKLPLVYAKDYERVPFVDKYLQLVGLMAWKNHLPSELSGGQQQRVCIARALMNQPKVLLCDEPTGALDQKSTKHILSILKALHKYGTTIVMVTHDLRFRKLGNRLLFVDKGKVREC